MIPTPKKACCPPVINLIGKILYRSDDEAILAGKIPELFSRGESLYREVQEDSLQSKAWKAILANPPTFRKPKRDEIVGAYDYTRQLWFYAVTLDADIPGERNKDTVAIQAEMDEKGIKTRDWHSLALFRD